MCRCDRQTHKLVVRIAGTFAASLALAAAVGAEGFGDAWEAAGPRSFDEEPQNREPASEFSSSPPGSPASEAAPFEVTADDLFQTRRTEEPALLPEDSGSERSPSASGDEDGPPADPFADPFDRAPSLLLRSLSEVRVSLDTPAAETLADRRFEQHRRIDLAPHGWVQQTPEAAAFRFYTSPLWCEDPNLERCGYSCCPCLQPAISGFHFYANTALLPYRAVAEPQCETAPAKSFCPPGRRYSFRDNYLPPPSAGGTAAEAAAITGLIFLIP